MIPEFGHFALVVALFVALAQAVLGLAGAHRRAEGLMAAARAAAQGQFVLVALASGALTTAFVTSDFSVALVAAHSHTQLPLAYRIAATWGSHEGSMLLWALMLAGWSGAASIASRALPEPVVARVLGMLGLVAAGFLLFVLLTSNPFGRLLPPALEGRDLNPLLQDPAMVLHPPMLYMGYVGFAVTFAFAIAALLGGRLDAAWARWSRPWALAAWVSLTLGIALGSFWAYYELGWGGWWFWDPVENASFMPWLAGTALLHSLAVAEKRGALKGWTVLLAILAFSLSLLGTFLVRSGVLTSVHSFASDPKRGVFILALLAVVVGASLALFAWRAARLRGDGGFAAASRETALLANNVVLLAAAGSVLLGTLYPLVLDALGLGRISVGAPYFETVFVPLMLPLLALMALVPFVGWRSANPVDVLRRSRGPLTAAIVMAAAASWTAGAWTPLSALATLLGAWIIAASVAALRTRLGTSPPALARRFARLAASRAFIGMQVAHAGIGVFVLGVALVKVGAIDVDAAMSPGDRATAGAYEFRFDGIGEVAGPNYVAARATLRVMRDDREIAVLQPEKRAYIGSAMPMTEAAIDYGLTRHLYVSLGEALPGGAWAVRAQVKPFVGFIWIGCLLMALGGLLALSDARYRRGAVQREAPRSDLQPTLESAPPV